MGQGQQKQCDPAGQQREFISDIQKSDRRHIFRCRYGDIADWLGTGVDHSAGAGFTCMSSKARAATEQKSDNLRTGIGRTMIASASSAPPIGRTMV